MTITDYDFCYDCNHYEVSFNKISILLKQPSEMFCKKSVFKKFRKFRRKTPALEYYFNQVARLKLY